MEKITLSYSTINNCLQPTNSHNWLNKQMGIKPEDKPYYHEGTEGHRIIQQYLLGKKTEPHFYKDLSGEDKECIPYMENIKYRFPIVEERDFDPKCKFTIDISESVEVIGYIDALDPENKRFGEIKLSVTPWGFRKYVNSNQKKIYSMAFPDFKEAVLITGGRNPEFWEHENLKVYPVPLTDKDRKDGLKYIMEAVKLLEEGDFTGGLDEDGVCRNKFCYYGENCHFKEKNAW
jgi:hypothetical protein